MLVLRLSSSPFNNARLYYHYDLTIETHILEEGEACVRTPGSNGPSEMLMIIKVHKVSRYSLWS